MPVLRKVVVCAFVLLLPAFPRVASAEPVSLSDPAFSLAALGGEVGVYFAGSEAGYDTQLFLGSDDSNGPYFPNHSTALGAFESLGMFSPGADLIFRLAVLTTGYNYFTGAGSGNSDGIVHARAQAFSGDANIPVAGVLIGFEDMHHGGDFDFNDFSFVVTNARLSAVPEPGTLLLVGAGVAGLVGAGRRGRRRKALSQDKSAS